jgi:hypothetical protein
MFRNNGRVCILLRKNVFTVYYICIYNMYILCTNVVSIHRTHEGDSRYWATGTTHYYSHRVRRSAIMDLESARNEIRHPSRVRGMDLLTAAAACVAIAAVVVQLIP